MRPLFLIVFLFVANIVFGQKTKRPQKPTTIKSPYTYVLGKIKQGGKGKPKMGPISDSVTITNDSASIALAKLIKEVEKNGTADVSKCFIPRHAILVYESDSLVKKVLICFECDGVRIYDYKTEGTEEEKEPNVEKREKQMKQIGTFFNKFYRKEEAPTTE